MRRVALEERKEIAGADHYLRWSFRQSAAHLRFLRSGRGLVRSRAKQNGLEGILAKRRTSLYEERRSREWLKIKITQTVDCVIGGYTDPEGSRQHFGAIVLGLYDKKKRLIHVGQAGTGFDQARLKELGAQFKKFETTKNPFYGHVEARHAHWLKPELVAEIKFTEWTHETAEGGMKLRAPVFLALRDDKKPEECTLAEQNLRMFT